MKSLSIVIIALILVSCGTKVPYTNEIRDEFGLESEVNIKKVQFFTSATIILKSSFETGNSGTNEDGALVTNSNKNEERVVIPIGTKCVFDSFGENGDVKVRFEMGAGKTLAFNVRQGQTSGKYYLVADWKGNNGGELEYADETYFATSESGLAYLQVILKKLQRTKRKDRVVRGLKV